MTAIPLPPPVLPAQPTISALPPMAANPVTAAAVASSPAIVPTGHVGVRPNMQNYPLPGSRMNAFQYPYGDAVAWTTCEQACAGTCPTNFCPASSSTVPMLPVEALNMDPVKADNNKLNAIVYDNFRSNFDHSIEDMRKIAIAQTFKPYDQPSVVFASNGANVVRRRAKFSFGQNRDLRTIFTKSNGQEFYAMSDAALYKLATQNRSRLKRPVHSELDK